MVSHARNRLSEWKANIANRLARAMEGRSEGGPAESGLNDALPIAGAMPANPKQAFGDKKLPLYLVPVSFVSYVSTALFEGMIKYGLVNWRAAEVEAMTYVSALNRHVFKWVNGERCDPETKVHHLANAAACLCILLDAELNGSMIDNRPLPLRNVDTMFAELEATIEHLKALHSDKTPYHWTMKDAPV